MRPCSEGGGIRIQGCGQGQEQQHRHDPGNETTNRVVAGETKHRRNNQQFVWIDDTIRDHLLPTCHSRIPNKSHVDESIHHRELCFMARTDSSSSEKTSPGVRGNNKGTWQKIKAGLRSTKVQITKNKDPVWSMGSNSTRENKNQEVSQHGRGAS